ncbi:MAG: outer membrane lipoprotein carrier protein LolA, partial [Acidobacteriaceae bacterium]
MRRTRAALAVWILPALLLAFVPVAGAGEAPALTAQQIAKRVDAHYNHLHSLRVQFTETYTGMGRKRTESGTLLLAKPGRMKWLYAEPAGKLFVIDGKYGYSYTPGEAQAERYPA